MIKWDSDANAKLITMINEGKTYREIATVFGVTRNCISGAVYRARNKKLLSQTYSRPQIFWNEMGGEPKDGTRFIYYAPWLKGTKKQVCVAYWVRGKFAMMAGSYVAHPSGQGKTGYWAEMPAPPEGAA